MNSHEFYIQRCFVLASRADKSIKSNPKVGAVITHNDRIIGEGYHQYKGGPHAEVNAIASVSAEDRHLLSQATIYVSLEPCNHHGATPPCSSLIIENKIPNVVISVLDPNPLMQGKSVRLLEENGINVSVGVLEKEGTEVITEYIVTLTQKRPYIILKQVQSRDGFIGKRNTRTWLSNQWTSILSHKWRTEIDAIVIGVHTANIDNPALTSRSWHGDDPLRIVLDPNDRIKDNIQLLTDNKSTIIFSNKDKIKAGVQWIKIDKHKTIITQLMEYCYANELYKVLIEGGAKTINEFLKEKTWDEARVVRTSTLLKEGIKANNITGRLSKSINYEEDEILYIRNE